jgi:micrococcal nuclease
MGKYLILVAIVLAFIAGYFSGSLVPPYTGQIISQPGNFSGLKMVTRVIDGDTVVIEGESVRLLGIDSDERGDPCYKEAKERLEELVLNREVRLESDTEDRDIYGRYLRFIFLDGRNIDLQLVGEGLAAARFSPGNEKYKNVIIAAEKQARENKIGCKWQGLE